MTNALLPVGILFILIISFTFLISIIQHRLSIRRNRERLNNFERLAQLTDEEEEKGMQDENRSARMPGAPAHS